MHITDEQKQRIVDAALAEAAKMQSRRTRADGQEALAELVGDLVAHINKMASAVEGAYAARDSALSAGHIHELAAALELPADDVQAVFADIVNEGGQTSTYEIADLRAALLGAIAYKYEVA